MSSSWAFSPDSANAASAALSTFSRFRTASARRGFSVRNGVTTPIIVTPLMDTVSPAPAPESPLYARRWWALAVLCLSLLIVFVGNSSLNVAIPTLSRVLGATTSQLQWVIAIYSLVFAGLLFSTGALGDRFGRKGALQAGLVIYLLACVAATRSD